MEKRSDNRSDQHNRPSRRQLTSFLCREMLYDYATGRLDSERRLDVEAFLKDDVSSREVLSSINRGLECAEELSHSQVDPAIFKRLGESENARTLVSHAARWGNWPESLRWSISALGISAITALLIAYIPWAKLPSFNLKKNQTIVLADIPKDASDGEAAETAADSGEADDSEAEVAGDDSAADTSGDEHEAPGDAQVAATIAKQEAKAQAQAAVAATLQAPVKPVATPVAAPTKAGQTVAAAPPLANIPAVQDVRTIRGSKVAANDAGADEAAEISDDAKTDAQTSDPVKSGDKKLKGFVYRAFMNLGDVQALTPEIVEKLEGLGAEKAGEVPLGWRRGEGSYFHFKVPEANQDTMLEMLRAYGPVRISKDPHPRVMPKGQIRIILWIEPSH